MNWDSFSFYLNEIYLSQWQGQKILYITIYIFVSICFSWGAFFAEKEEPTDVEDPLVAGAIYFLVWPVLIPIQIVSEEGNLARKYALRFSPYGIIICLSAFGIHFTYNEITMSQQQKLAKAEKIYQTKKYAIYKDYEYKLREAKAQVKLAEIAAKQRALYSGSSETKIEYNKRIAKAQAELNSLKARGVNYSELSQATIPSSKSELVDRRTKLTLSALWLGACFFLQRLFEKLFKDQGYALLTVCAAGFLLAFFTANYFLLGGSITGGIMGSVGDRA